MMSEYVIRDGTVIGVEPAFLVVRMDSENESDCGGCGSCAVKGLCRGRDSAHMDLTVPRSGGDDTDMGARVRVQYRGTNPAIASLVMFVPGLLGVVFGGFIANALAGAGDGIFLAGAVGGLALGIGVTFLVARSSSLFGADAKLVTGR